MYKIFLLKNDENDATDYYLRIISEAIEKKGEQCIRVYSLHNISREDKILTIQPKAFLKVWVRNKKQYIVHWFQGILPEEAMVIFRDSFSKKYPRYIFYYIIEQFVLKYSRLNIFVSDAMRLHYYKKYNYIKTNYFIMPCFNQLLDEEVFKKERYDNPKFVYVGSLSKWQCINETLILFKKIKNIIPHSALTLLTKEEKTAQSLIEKYNLQGVEIKYVPYQKLNEELIKYKFGFLLRDNIAVNNVATPTKMNSYLANGIIPIYSDVIFDFIDIFQECKYFIRATQNIEDFINNIQFFENVNLEQIRQEYKSIFSSYYNKNIYVSKLSEIL